MGGHGRRICTSWRARARCGPRPSVDARVRRRAAVPSVLPQRIDRGPSHFGSLRWSARRVCCPAQLAAGAAAPFCRYPRAGFRRRGSDRLPRP